MEIKTKKDVISAIQEGQTIRPIVLYDLISNKVLSWKEFEHLFMLYYKGEHKEQIKKTYEVFWDMLEKRMTHAPNDEAQEENQ